MAAGWPARFPASPVRPAFVAASAIGLIFVRAAGARLLQAAHLWSAIVAPSSRRPAGIRPTRRETAPAAKRQVIQHIVLFTPKATLSDDERRTFASRTLGTLTGCSQIARLTIGRRAEIDAGYERLFGDKTYEYAAVLEFSDQAGLVHYLNTPEHAELGRLFWENCESTVVSEVELIDVLAPDAVDKLV